VTPHPRIVRRSTSGFTLIEALIVVAVIAIIAGIAVPAFTDYVRRARIIEAISALADLRTRSEQYFLDNRTYLGACASIGPVVQAQTRAFTIACVDAATTYRGTATGAASLGMGGFVYAIDHTNARSSTITAPGWRGNATCWAIRKDGSCG